MKAKWLQTLERRPSTPQMIEWGSTHLPCKSCIYDLQTDSGIVIAAVHVHDYFDNHHSQDANEHFQDQMCKVWTISNWGRSLIMGIAVTWDRATCTVTLSQQLPLIKIIEQFARRCPLTSAPLNRI